MACRRASTSRACANCSSVAARLTSGQRSFQRRSPSSDARTGLCAIWYSHSWSNSACSAWDEVESAACMKAQAARNRQTHKDARRTRNLPNTGLSASLLALLESDRGRDGLAVPQNFDFDHVADLAAAERVGEVVEVLDGLIAELHQDVSGFEPGLGGGRTGAHVRKLHAV